MLLASFGRILSTGGISTGTTTSTPFDRRPRIGGG
jgi:hypothetical protein